MNLQLKLSDMSGGENDLTPISQEFEFPTWKKSSTKVPRFIRQICFKLTGWRGPASSPQELTMGNT